MESFIDMLTKIRNAQSASKNTVSVVFSNFKHSFAKILEKEGFIEEAKKRGKEKKRIVIKLKYENDIPRINEIKMISKPSRHIYFKNKRLYLPKKGKGILIISTSKGLLTSKEASKEKIGGEALCEIW